MLSSEQLPLEFVAAFTQIVQQLDVVTATLVMLQERMVAQV